MARRVAPLLLALAACTLMAGCAGPGPDPGNKQLHALAADPMFASLPPNTVRISWQETPARNLGLFGGGWHNPYVTLRFTSTQSVEDVFRFYAQRAAQAGWAPLPELPTGLIGYWKKGTFGNRYEAFASLTAVFDIHHVSLTETGTPRPYTLGAGSSPRPIPAAR
ncbi:MAG: hypothetical protein J2P28_01615 [Actinobacteria bacterium]|nr:hypothetical protein [Actinomycetota bacterium]